MGSAISLLDAFRSAANVLRLGLERAVDLCSTTPARVAGLGHVGAIEIGRRADLVLLSDDLDVRRVLVAGRVAYVNKL